jgi:hypothetical protein
MWASGWRLARGGKLASAWQRRQAVTLPVPWLSPLCPSAEALASEGRRSAQAASSGSVPDYLRSGLRQDWRAVSADDSAEDRDDSNDPRQCEGDEQRRGSEGRTNRSSPARLRTRRLRHPACAVPFHGCVSNFGSPAGSGSPVALRPRLAPGLPFRCRTLIRFVDPARGSRDVVSRLAINGIEMP